MLTPTPPDPPLSDEVVRLRPWRLDDVPAVAAACGEREIARWLDAIPQPYTEADARTYIEGTMQAWREGVGAPFAIVDRESGVLLGSIGLRVHDLAHGVCEVGYWVGKEARGRGVATRAVRLLAAWALDALGAERLQLRAEAKNVASQRVAERAGFRREGVLRSFQFNPRQGRRMDWVMFSLLPGELG
jgi:RimJ/RimL family protein N-acetyltransferase